LKVLPIFGYFIFNIGQFNIFAIMPTIEFIILDQNGLDKVKSLWEGLRDHHFEKSDNFKERYKEMTFNSRKAGLLKKIEHGKMRIDLAIHPETKEPVGYCINTIVYMPDPEGEIESLFVHPDYRKNRIAEKLINFPNEWFDSNNIVTRKVVVAAGNEEVFPFYKKFGFYHKFSTLENNPN
jgi:ribosomal protein S18 acetylase RimI-like enzyme